jgi:pimeloyl-ACP methyl ester carboxylesterase
MYRSLIYFCLLLIAPTIAVGAEIDAAPAASGRLIVFVNGINSDIQGTFSNPDTGAFWPKLMREDDSNVFDRADIMSYEIDTDFGGESPRITDIADKMALDLNDTLASYTSVVFVAHSLGGVVLRRYLLTEARKDDGGITSDNRIKGLLLLGTPMNGAVIANLGSGIFESQTLWQLGQSNDADSFLDTLRDEWIDEGMVPLIPTQCGYETVGVRVKFLWWESPGVKVVTPDSASTLCSTGVTGLARLDHFGIAQPDDAQAQPYALAARWYREIFDDPEDVALPGDVALANCEVNRYGKSLFDKLAKSLYDEGISMRITPRLPQDWTASTPNSLLWTGSAPRLLVIHYSCFQDEEGEEEGILEERRVDFNEFLESLAETDVKVLAYSRAFYPDFVEDNITRVNRGTFGDGRLLMLPLRHGSAVSDDVLEKFEEIVARALAN